MTNRLQPIYDIAALCSSRQLRHAVLCPGSRNAPLILAFSRHPDIHCLSISDERSAAFIALGISQQVDVPAVIVSTSGSAAFNFAPAVAEAYFAQIPLLVLTADRPTEWVGQQDGQTIHQQDIFGKHVKRSFQLPQEYDHADNYWAINRMVNEAISLTQQEPRGPVHINVPLREPLYPGNEKTEYSSSIRVMSEVSGSSGIDSNVAAKVFKKLSEAKSILLVSGQQTSGELRTTVFEVSRRFHIPLIGDALSNLHGADATIQHADLFLGAASPDVLRSLQPDLLITIGEGTLSKNLKLFLRSHKAAEHWHIQEAGNVADTFQSVTDVLRVSAGSFFRFLSEMTLPPLFDLNSQIAYEKRWTNEEQRTVQLLNSFFPQSELGEAEVVLNLLRGLPPSCNVHLANSMSVRYAAHAGLISSQPGVRVYSNRGTSGIDGCTSTAVGHALTSNVPNILITGDMAFFYDRNAFWHNYPLPNLHILLLNNHGGGIFKMIDGPGNIAELDEFLVTRQPLTAKKLCEEFGFEYSELDSRRKMSNAIKDLLEPSTKTKVLEFSSGIDTNKSILLSLKRLIKDSYEH
ncbi:2-succinyl-5-enolpyruvyl-6-hydroxy-3-cyclohexene-1-carboxylic-acid synthase [Chryseolinea sp. T2]|uniref:2-succinyl-5-enolpyruvyl-6-hydroxy-3- cyclohexene-1-carboxylic-acid synthase n=1 Tax=Chryseolinea sp. T2 TaxID=3129255 RepID=UPI0030788CD7